MPSGFPPPADKPAAPSWPPAPDTPGPPPRLSLLGPGSPCGCPEQPERGARPAAIGGHGRPHVLGTPRPRVSRPPCPDEGGLWPWLPAVLFPRGSFRFFPLPGYFHPLTSVLISTPALLCVRAPPPSAPAMALCPGFSLVRLPEILTSLASARLSPARPLNLFILVTEDLSPAGGLRLSVDRPFPVSYLKSPAGSKHPRPWLNTALAAHDGGAALLARRAGAGRPTLVLGMGGPVASPSCPLLSAGSWPAAPSSLPPGPLSYTQRDLPRILALSASSRSSQVQEHVRH